MPQQRKRLRPWIIGAISSWSILHFSTIHTILHPTNIHSSYSSYSPYSPPKSSIITQVTAFSPSFRRIRHPTISSRTDIPHYEFQQNPNQYKSHYTKRYSQLPNEQGGRGLIDILNKEVSELLLDRLYKKLYNENEQNQHQNQQQNQKQTQQQQQQQQTMKFNRPTEGLSKTFRSIVASTMKRQRCVTGKYPLTLSIVENPTRKWLSTTSNKKKSPFSSLSSSSSVSESSTAAASSQMIVNGTSLDKSLASFERYQWLDQDEIAKMDMPDYYSIELLAEIHMKNPAYVNVLPASSAGSLAEQRRNDGIWKNKWKEGDDVVNEYGVVGEYGVDNDTYVSNPEPLSALKIIQNEELERLERLWVTGFSLTKQRGDLCYVDVESGYMGKVSDQTIGNSIRWPNEVNSVPKVQNDDKDAPPKQQHQHQHQQQQQQKQKQHHSANQHEQQKLDDALLISDGFLVPGRDNGGLYIISSPGHTENEWKICLAGGNGVDGLLSKLEHEKSQKDGVTTIAEEGWFYHRSIWIDLTGDGRQSVLTARAKRPSILKNSKSKKHTSTEDKYLSTLPTEAQLVWLERPKPFKYDESTGTPLDSDGLVFDPFSPRHTPWKVRVLDTGPDVMFSVADLDTTDDTIEVFASQFFNKKVTVHSIQRGPEPRVVFRRTLDDHCGASFSSVLANLDMKEASKCSERVVIDSGSTVPTLVQGDGFSHLLVTSHECTFASEDDSNLQYTDEIRDEPHNQVIENNKEVPDGGSLFAYRVPCGKDAWKTEPWIRTIIATGFRVEGQLGNMINPGAPGFCYTFFPFRKDPKIKTDQPSRPLIGIAGDCAESAYLLRPVTDDNNSKDPSANYAMMCEIECGATVGSIGIGYEDFCYAPQQSGYAKIYVPCYEKDKVLVFSLGNVDGVDDDDDGW